ncbi:substrate-binding periplasmic protein [Undibacterium terreum]|uniref:substrate-binding periplasmic protein n=1 Tax=Undibacterium terreum TaxID=1224302 RepID=UPI001666E687|nr:transporter substrate-binding domain-containing protein [Undibacterium terreum]
MSFLSLLARQKIAVALLFGALFCTSSQAQLVFAVSLDQGPSALMAQRVLLEAYRQLGISLRFEALPNPRIVGGVNAGSIDGVDFRIANTQLGDLQKIAVPIAYEELVVFSTGKRFKVAGYHSLQAYSIGYLSGAKIFEEKLKGMHIDAAPNLESLFNKLDAGRTDVAVDARASYCKARKLGLNKVIILEPSLEKILAYHWLSKRHENLMPKVEGVLKKMKQDDAIRKIQEEVWQEFNAHCGA